MRLKEIKPGMVIHCKDDEEKKALLEEAERLGYRWGGTANLPTSMPNNLGSTIHFHEKNEFIGFKHIAWSKNTEGVTEFSDLIMPELTAEEAIRINTQLCFGSCDECPLYKVDGYSDCDDLCINNTEKAIEILAQWKSDHEKKEPEIETVDICRIIEIQPDGKKRCVHEEDIKSELPFGGDERQIVQNVLKRYLAEHDGNFIAVHEVVSRVKK